MTTKDLYSIRMRASFGAMHVSGAERLVPAERIPATVQELVHRAMTKDVGPDQVTVTIDVLGSTSARAIVSLDLLSMNEADIDACRKLAADLLLSAGVSKAAAANAFSILDRGSSSAGGNMRGAMLVDAVTGDRLEPDRARGVRVSRFDWTDGASDAISRSLSTLGLSHFRTKEALALASKVAHAPGVIAELCWSDDPDYTAGYVASRTKGYVRLPHMKPFGHGQGGRAFFINTADLDLGAIIDYLQNTPVLIDRIGTCETADETSLFGKTE